MLAYRTDYKMQNYEWERLNQDQLQSWYWDTRNRGMINSVRKAQCKGCGNVFYTQVRSKIYCDYKSCGVHAFRRMKRQEREDARADTECLTCGALFTPKRAGARYCSNACRQKAYRDRNEK